MLVWIQRHDFSYEELSINSSKEAIAAFQDYDWKKEYSSFNETSEECCPPGFGIVSEDRYILHLCPDDSGSCLIHFHYPVREKVLFFFTRDNEKVITRESVSWDEGILLIERMFLGNLEEMIDIINEPIAGS